MNGLTIGSLLISRSLKDRYRKQINRGVIEQNQKKKMSSYSEKKSSYEKERDANIRRNEELLRRLGINMRENRPTFQQKKQDFSSDSESESDQDWNPNENKQVPYGKSIKRKIDSSSGDNPNPKRTIDESQITDVLSFGKEKEIKINILKVSRYTRQQKLEEKLEIQDSKEITNECETLSIERSRRHLKPVDYTDEELTTEDYYIYCEECDELHFGNCPVDAELESLDETEMETNSMSTIPILKQLSLKVSSIPNAGLGNPGEELLVYYGDSYAKQLGIDNSESDDGNKEEKAIKESPVRRSVYRTQIEKQFKCQQCSCSYQNKGDLTRHTRIHTGIDLHICDFCQKRFTNELMLTIHARTHTGEKPFECLICKKKFAQSGDLTLHTLTHTGEKPFECTTCKKMFARSCSLTLHSRTHTGEKPYECLTCKKKFTTSGNLTSHIRLHTGEKPYECLTCQKRFTQSCNLTLHIRTHTGDKPFECRMCNKRFADSSHRNKHERTHKANH